MTSMTRRASLRAGAGVAAAAILKEKGYDARPLKDGYRQLLKAGFPEAVK